MKADPTDPNRVDAIEASNRSGYPLQAALIEAADEAENVTRWHVLRREHPWDDSASKEKRFLDILLSSHADDETSGDRYQRRMVVECKRINGSWVFQVPFRDAAQAAEVRVLHRFLTQAQPSGFQTLISGPPAFASEFCSLSTLTEKGFGPDGRTIEVWASELVRAGQFLLTQEARDVGAPPPPVVGALYIPVIVTTATLSVLIFDPKTVDLETGFVDREKARSEPVDWVRFSKDLGLERAGFGTLKPFSSPEDRHRQDVWIVRAASFVEFLRRSTTFRVRRS
jgi:hypothetical protein